MLRPGARVLCTYWSMVCARSGMLRQTIVSQRLQSNASLGGHIMITVLLRSPFSDLDTDSRNHLPTPNPRAD